MTTMTMPSPEPTLAMLLRVLKLPTIGRHAEEVATKAEREGWTFAQYLRHLASSRSRSAAVAASSATRAARSCCPRRRSRR